MKKLLLTAAALLPLMSAWAGTAAKDSPQAAPRPATAEELRALAAGHPTAAKRLAARPAIRRHADGAEVVALDASALNYTVVTRLPDGSLRTDCVTGEAEAHRIVAGAPPLAASKAHAEEHSHDR